MQNMVPVKMHQIVKPLCWLIGTWKSVTAKSDYPSKNIHGRPFNEIISFKSLGQPQLKFDALSWHPRTLLPIHIQNGYLYIDEHGKNVVLVATHSVGYAIVEVGTVNECSLKLESHIIGHADLSPCRVTQFRRSFYLNESGQLVYKMMLHTENEQNLFNHLRVIYERDPLCQRSPNF
ncbi:peroxynitrite isomerase THAP4-like [Diorhabda sublineata]|uniref:peroxynitrite isomerase THAP4-like n=1 Tax=Diorhabda sublineata TaxID=1163346 RepID=UPI0024E0AE67|nr:peroxynitrite isomerase THAP4-like [Diorhabda sublineata]